MILLYLLFTTQMAAFTTVTAGGIISFLGMSSIALVGGIIGIAIGFDMLTREKESGSLRTLLSHPVFRDEILLGKAIAALLAIAVIVFITMLVIVGVAMFYGYMPKSEDFFMLAKFALATIAYMFAMFCISLTFSAFFKSSSSSLTASIILFAVLSIVLPLIAYSIASAIVGPEPTPPPMDDKSFEELEKDPEWQRYEKEQQEHSRRVQEIASTIMLISPMQSYTAIVSSIAAPSYASFYTADVTKNAISFIIIPLVFLTASYVRFTREEL